MNIKSGISAILFVFFLFSCDTEDLPLKKTERNIVIIVMDGVRYSETWGEPERQFIPKLAGEMLDSGTLIDHFYNNGHTTTTAGHIALTTGFYETIDNSGNEWPSNPSVFHYWNMKYADHKADSWIISSKDKLEVLSKCIYPLWMNIYSPETDCGINGLGTGYRHDSITCQLAVDILNQYHPGLVLINFREPDYSAHLNNWNAYLEGILNTDSYIYQIWTFINNDEFYRDNTDFFVTNDHGRHLDSIGEGFSSHGDSCEGCRHISLFASGPDIRKGLVLSAQKDLLDFNATLCYLLGIGFIPNKGSIIHEMLRE